MNDKNNDTPVNNEPDYEAPKVEEVVTPSSLEREVQYAGLPISQQKA